MAHAEPHPASTVVLVRPAAPRFEVFLVRRRDSLAFMGGAHVFPGGRVDSADYHVPPERLCKGAAGCAAARMTDAPLGDVVAHHVAAIRELFEEAGVLLARDSSGTMIRIGPAREPEFAAYRRQRATGAMTICDLARREGLRLALDALAYFSRWITPQIETRRFDTRFFLAIMPESQHATHDDGETSRGEWMEPAEAIAAGRRGVIALPPPTWATLSKLATFATVGEAWRWARSCPIPRVEPGFRILDDGRRLVVLPGDPICPPAAGFEAVETRFLLERGRWRPVRP